MTNEQAFAKGYKFGQEWIGPNGDGSMGSLSMDTVLDVAARAIGAPYGVQTDREDELVDAFLDGFHEGRP